ncbi:hypothetical protein HG535_0A04130 [Zygotorulaspora mrakii]|uniref:Bis(5'-adenosyl)-triphosphatase n=1 Tax=Zygotorulaspora mrakii TaxID=42260 RepID=A0A7H9AW81_ZYGMR|nr:uncharacterized protein HG535_0A04130 [Zygotorulaspora mrakii]QLG70473.1 hypothetical protein HG535_0A04130 [Zygotorulaspora mrakii]
MTKAVYFSKFQVTSQVFLKTHYSYALVNLKPLVPGHVLVVPLRTQAIRLSDLSTEESIDFFQTVQLVQKFIYWQYKADSMNIAIQDGPEAGQTVPQLHAHIIPRYKANNIGDKIYDKINGWRFQEWENDRREYLKTSATAENSLAKPDCDRKPRTLEDMSKESQDLKARLDLFLEEHSEISFKNFI